MRLDIARVYFNHPVIKRLFSTTIRSFKDNSAVIDENLLSKRFVGLEKNIW